LSGGRREGEQIRAVRHYTEEAVREGLTENPWEGLVGGVILGSAEYAQQLLKRVQRQRRKEPARARLTGRVSWEQIVKAVERAKGEQWESFQGRDGDWGRDAALWLGRHVGRRRLAELAALVEGCHYTTVAKAVSRFGKRLAQDAKLADGFEKIQNELSKF